MEPNELATRAELVIDPRLAEVWQLVWSCPADPDEGTEPVREGAGSEALLAALLRLAYLRGYADSAEEVGIGTLWRELGVRGPGPTAKGAARLQGARRPSRSSDR